MSLFYCSLLILFCLPQSNMLKKSGPNDIWLIGQGTSSTALCWYPSCPRNSSLWAMQRQAVVTKPLGNWVCANRLAKICITGTWNLLSSHSPEPRTDSASWDNMKKMDPQQFPTHYLLQTRLQTQSSHIHNNTHKHINTHIVYHKRYPEVRFNGLLASQQHIKLKSPFPMLFKAKCFCAFRLL